MIKQKETQDFFIYIFKCESQIQKARRTHFDELWGFYIINAKQLEHEANLEIVDSQKLCMSHPPKVCHAKYQGKLSTIIWCGRILELSHALSSTTQQDKKVVWEV
jgi:hypothetical protein